MSALPRATRPFRSRSLTRTFPSSRQSSAIAVVAKGATTGSTIYALPFSTPPIAIDAPNAYWVGSDGKLYRSPRDGEPLGVLATGLTQTPAQLAVDAKNVYWADTAAGTVSSVPIAGLGVVATVASQANLVGSVAADGQAAYWSTTNALWKRAE